MSANPLGVDDRQEPIGRWLDLESVLHFGVFVAAYTVAYRYGMSFSQLSASPFWFPDSVLLCALLKSRPERWWILFLAAVLIRLLSGGADALPSWFIAATIANDCAKGLIAALALRRFMGNATRFDTPQDFSAFALIAVLLVPAASAFGGAYARSGLGHDFWTAWWQWFMGDALAQLVITPAIFYWVFGAPWKLRLPDTTRMIEAAALTAGLVLTGYLASNTEGSSLSFTEARFYAPVPFLFWAAIRFGMLGASGAIGVVAFFAIEAALAGRGPFSGHTPDETALALQNFLLLRSAPLLLIAALAEESKAAAYSLRESEARFRHMANAAPMLLWMHDRDKQCEFVNQSWLTFTGRHLEQALGEGWKQDLHADDLQHCVDVFFSAFDERRPFQVEGRLRRADGAYRWFLGAGSPRTAPGGDFLGYIGSAIDITDIKRAEEHNRHLVHVQRLAVIGELTAIVAHEVRQPLAAILSNARAATELLAAPEPPLKEIGAILDDIYNDDLRANEVITRIQGFARKAERRQQPVDLNAIVSDVCRLVAADARGRRVRIETVLATDIPSVLGDPTQLRQVLLNLTLNAMDAMADTPEQARQLTIQTKPHDPQHAEVAVIDRGRGISPDKIDLVFETFFTMRKEGIGLGLAIARSIIADHHGRIWAEANESGGATFRFTVPVVDIQAQS